jgi:cobalt-zinc-cadmium efflux system membrane fusion protein
MSETTTPASSRGMQLLILFLAGGLIVAATVVVLMPDLIGRGKKDKPDKKHDDHASGSSIELSPQALKNVNARVEAIQLKTFERTINVPGMIVEIPGRSHRQVTAPLTGVVTRVYPTQGQEVRSGDPLFEVRLTHEELVEAQSALLRVSAQLDVERREVKRLREVNRSGGLAGARLLEHVYEQEKLEADLQARARGLQLHGLSEAQVDKILKQRQLVDRLTVYAPAADASENPNSKIRSWQFEHVQVVQGQHVSMGQQLAVLADLSHLYIEGKAFEEDTVYLRRVSHEGWKIKAFLRTDHRRPEIIKDLQIVYVASEIDAASRALPFYLKLKNELLSSPKHGDAATTGGTTFLNWRFRPGQRLRLEVPIKRSVEQIVLPTDAVVREGAENYVYQENGRFFEQRAVHVIDRDGDEVHIANDGSIYVGDRVATSGAYLIHLAIKNAAGSGADPHAGHSH